MLRNDRAIFGVAIVTGIEMALLRRRVQHASVWDLNGECPAANVFSRRFRKLCLAECLLVHLCLGVSIGIAKPGRHTLDSIFLSRFAGSITDDRRAWRE